MIKTMTAIVDGKQIAYSSETVFIVQIGKGKSRYKTLWTFTGSIAQAILMYKGINCHNGYKKRLLVPSFNKPVLARSFS